MKWLLFGDFARTVGLTSVQVRVEGAGDGQATVRDALAALLERHPELRDSVLDGGSLAEDVHVVHNHVDIYHEPGQLDASVAVGDELALFSPIT